MRIHISNAAYEHLQTLTTEYQQICYSYEDFNLDGQKKAEALYEWMDRHTPGQYHLLSTGDYIGSKLEAIQLGRPGFDRFLDWETYNPEYRHILIPVAVWNQHQAEVMQVDRWWRQEAEAIATGIAMPTWWVDHQENVEAWWESYRQPCAV